ncbi:hypothetical protein GH714_012510 [Hevea brasiliensis]|uniref:Uncharacterized protein n=1 Tax=Hevea brasiliensis TaxID=3981 RepID=A0A6A6N3H9_HEVBR|nr:hypothetical protein GH714_012510 [Hevea brasiliensis]
MLDWELTNIGTQPIGTSAQSQDDKDYTEPPAAPLFEPTELTSWSFYRAVKAPTKCSTVGIQGIAWSFGGMIFALVYCTAGISGGHINPAVTFGLFLARKLSLTRALYYMVMQCLGAICGAGVVKGFEGRHQYTLLGGGANSVNPGYTKGDGLGAEIVGTFVLVYTVFSATDAKRTGINPARSLGAAIIFNKDKGWDDHWIFWVGPFIGAALAALYHQVVIRAIPFKK